MADKQQAEDRAAAAERRALQAVEEERARAAEAKAAQEAETAKREADKEHKERVMQEAQTGLFDNCKGISILHTRLVVEAIAAGKIPHVTISY